MVSIGGNNPRIQGGGGYVFESDTQPIVDHENDRSVSSLNDRSFLSTDTFPQFTPIRNLWCIVLNLLLMILTLVAIAVITFVCEDGNDGTCGTSTTRSFPLVVYWHSGLWFIQLAIYKYMQYEHGINRMNGYLEFYRYTRTFRRLPIFIIGTTNSLLLSVIIIMEIYCSFKQNPDPSNIHCPGVSITKTCIVLIVTCLEQVFLLPVLITYLVRVARFNYVLRPLPDIFLEEHVTSFMQSHPAYGHGTEIGIRDQEASEDIIEKQADMIRYLRQHNRYLGQRLHRMSQQLNSVSLTVSS